jgi:hypothetical protein
MLLKIVICLLLLANIVALAMAYRAMMVDMGKSEGTRTAKYLTIRVALGAVTIGTVVFGMATGQLGVSAPWL